MKTKWWAICSIILCTVCTSIGAFFNKKGAMALQMSLKGTIFNPYLILGLACLGIGYLFLMISLKGGEVSVIYPIIATSYIWVVLVAYYSLNEPLNHFKILGIIFVIGGVILLTTGHRIMARLRSWGVFG
jgi:uncharacterized membrane protein